MSTFGSGGNAPKRPSSPAPSKTPTGAKPASAAASKPTAGKPTLSPQPAPKRMVAPVKLGPQPAPQRLAVPAKSGTPASLKSAPKVGAKPGAPLAAPAMKGPTPFKQGVISNPMRASAPKIGNKG